MRLKRIKLFAINSGAACFKIFKKIPSHYVAKELFISFLMDYLKRRSSAWKTFLIHRRGFTVSEWKLMELDKHDYRKYLTTVEYFRMHPLNGKHSWIIDSKLTLKQQYVGTKIDSYLPEYYYKIDADGKVKRLSDCPFTSEEIPSVREIVELLSQRKKLAVKLIAGSIGKGFYKCEYDGERVFANGDRIDDPDAFFSGLRNYIITEYLTPHPEIAKYCPFTANAIRYLVGRMDGELKFLKGYVRFGTRQSGFVENYNIGGVLCYLDRDGQFSSGNVIDPQTKTNLIITKHPDTGAELKGRIPCWDKIKTAVKEFGDQFPQLSYLGFDFVVTSDERIKILEINSLTSNDGLQLNGPILETEAGAFFKARMK